MSTAYFFNNETKNESVYVKNIGTYTLGIEVIANKILHMKKWETSDTVIIMLMDSKGMSRYIYKDNRFDLCFKEDSKYDMIEIETDENECYKSEIGEDDYDEDYDDEYDEYDDYDERDYDERDYDGGYEDEFYECCDIY
jgi:hypothetical protein